MRDNYFNARKTFSFLILCAIFAYNQTIIDEDFKDFDAWIDLSAMIPWGGDATAGKTAFATGEIAQKQCAYIAPEAKEHSGYAKDTDLKTFTALDYVFDAPINHRTDTLVISFDARWDNPNAYEGGRFMVILMDEYPDNGVSGADLTNLEGDPYGTPAVHVRIRPGMTTLLQYGGGHGGEFEKYSGKWWLPGFIQNALPPCCPSSCTDDNQCIGSPGHVRSPSFPDGSWLATDGDICDTLWNRYTYKVTPHLQQIYIGDLLKASMPLPETLGAAGYEYYEKFVAMRLYWRAVRDAYIANVNVSLSSPGTRIQNRQKQVSQRSPRSIGHSGLSIQIPLGATKIMVFSLSGKLIFSRDTEANAASIVLPENLGSGAVVVRFAYAGQFFE